MNPNQPANLLPTDREVAELFTLLRETKTPYLLVGGIAMLRYVEGRNTEDIDLLMSLPSLRQLPEITIEEQNDYFIGRQQPTTRTLRKRPRMAFSIQIPRRAVSACGGSPPSPQQFPKRKGLNTPSSRNFRKIPKRT